MITTEWAKNPQTNAPRSITEPAAPEPRGDSEGAATQVVGLEPDRGLLGRIDDLQNELAAMTQERDHFEKATAAHFNQLSASQAENEALRKDAERWRKTNDDV